jgi:signal transduction histidine kinase
MSTEWLLTAGDPWAPGDPRWDQLRRRAEAAIAAERRISDRFARLHAASAALSAALTPGDVASVIASRGHGMPGSVGCAVALLRDADGDGDGDGDAAIALAASRGPSGRASGRPGVLPAAAELPFAGAIQARVPLFVPDRETPARARAAAGGAAACELPDDAVEALAVLPLTAGGRVLGAVAIAFGQPRDFDEEERAFLEAFVHQGSQALDRARLYEAERSARLEAQHAEEAARGAVELQERLVGVVGHDLRTPLAAIRMAVSLLFRRGGLSEDQARTLARLGASTARMTSIIRDLLDFTRVRREGAIPVVPRSVDLSEIARHAVAELASVHLEREIWLSLPESAAASGDPERLVQVVSNLVGNALQHSPPGARVELSVHADAGGVVLQVHNEGPPIRPDLLPDLFEPFRRGTGNPDPSGSIGLGLFIVRELVRAHGGRVDVASSEGAGTTFTVRLPRPPGAAAEAPPAAEVGL